VIVSAILTLEEWCARVPLLLDHAVSYLQFI